MAYYGPKDVAKEIVRLQDMQKEILARIEQAKQGHQSRIQLLAYAKKQNMTRSDVGWVYAQMPATRITRKARLKRARSSQLSKNAPKPELQAMGDRMTEARKAKGISVKEASAKLGLHPSVIAGYEKGKWRAGPEARAKIEKLYDITIKYPNSNGGS
jgi:ribosome-binding protein aMBF1 (putative translation factor)